MEDYKEKYEQAMLRMNKWVEGSEITDPKEVAEFVFPELKESEDERIRKECISIIDAWDKSCRLQGDYCEVASKCIAWLEKQGKNEEINEASYRAGIKRVLDSPESYGLERQGEQKFEEEPEKAKEDESNRRALNLNEIAVGDIITYFRNGKKGIMLVSSFDSGIYPRCKWGISDIRGTAYGDWNPGGKTYYAATEEEKQQLLNTMPKYIKEWFEKQREQKPVWSEEDEKHLLRCLNYLSCITEFTPDYNDFLWLKSLKERMKG